jgi:hypothetical protein
MRVGIVEIDECPIVLKNGPVAFIKIDDDFARNVALGTFFDSFTSKLRNHLKTFLDSSVPAIV